MVRASRYVPEELHERVFAEARRRFGPGNRYGVLGVAIDWPRRSGRWGDGKAVVAYVRTKQEAPLHPVPDVEVDVADRVLRFQPDVVGLGQRPRAHPSTAPPVWSGLHPGAAIAVGSGAGLVTRGGVSCLLAAGGEPRWLLTAGHLLPADPSPSPDGRWRLYAAPLGGAPREVGVCVGSLLDDPGADTPRDAAIFQLHPAGQAIVRVVDPRVFGAAADVSHPVRAQVLRSTTAEFSPPVLARPLLAELTFHARYRPAYRVSRPLETEWAVTIPGDSGAPLAAVEGRSLLGLTVGGFAEQSIFEPLSEVIARLSARMNVNLELWRQ